MKRVVLIVAISTLLYGDEIERINLLVDEIDGMRKGYEKCTQQLQICRSQKPKQQECKKGSLKTNQVDKRMIQNLQNENNNLKIKIKRYKDLQVENNNLKNQINKYKNLLKIKTEEIEDLQKKLTIAKKKTSQKRSHKHFKIITTQPKTFRTRIKADIFDKPDGLKIDRWEKGRSFTSYIKSGNWIKITGYFIDKKWTKAKKDLWIKEEDVFERD